MDDRIEKLIQKKIEEISKQYLVYHIFILMVKIFTELAVKDSKIFKKRIKLSFSRCLNIQSITKNITATVVSW